MATHFERQLEALHVQIITMGSFCEKAISLSNKAIRGEDCIKAIFETDREIDTKEREIENLCMRILLHQQPVARDLREVSAALKMISDMERIGDHAVNIAEWVEYVNMVTESVDAFVKRDLELCRKVIDDDDRVDDAFNQIKEELAELMYQNLDAKAGLDLLMTAKYMERIGDHAVNIAEWVEYAITGEHRNNEHQMGG